MKAFCIDNMYFQPFLIAEVALILTVVHSHDFTSYYRY